MAAQFTLTILTPERKLVDKKPILVATIPTFEGEIQILPGHAAMIGMLETGEMRVQFENEAQEMFGVISHGFFEVTDTEVILMATTLELKNEIDVARAKEAQKKAEKTLHDAGLDVAGFKKYQLKLLRSLARQHMAESVVPSGGKQETRH